MTDCQHTWSGTLRHLFVTESAGSPMTALEEVEAIAGAGLDGDRYATGKGKWSDRASEDRQVTLLEVEVLEALARDHDIELRPEESRRNLITQGVPLAHLVGKEFRVGSVTLCGGRLNQPCKYLEDLVDKPVMQPLLNRSGLNARVVTGGTIRAGDTVTPLD